MKNNKIWTDERVRFIEENYPKYGGEYCRDKMGLLMRQIRNYASSRKLEYKAQTKPGHRFCKACLEEKPFNCYHSNSAKKYGISDTCIPCSAILSKAKREKYRDKIKKDKKDYYERNKQKIISKVYSYKKNKLKTDPAFKLLNSIRKRFKLVFKQESFSKRKEEILGCSFADLKIYLESQFSETMNWNNYGKLWNIDHIIPVSLLSDHPDKVNLIFNWRNHQPIFSGDNVRKGNSIKDAIGHLKDKEPVLGKTEFYSQALSFLEALIAQNLNP